MAVEATSNPEKKDIFKDVRFFLAEENNEEVIFKSQSLQKSAIADEIAREYLKIAPFRTIEITYM